MFKNFLVSCLILTSFQTLADEITSPFYLPKTGHILATTEATYIKNKINTEPTTRIYQRGLNEEITVGLGSGVAALLQGDLDWTRQKATTTLSTPHTKGYALGVKTQGIFGGFLNQLTVLYHQQANSDFAPRREIEGHLRVGKTFQNMTPYLHLLGYFPLNARPEFDNPIYRGETGVFQGINSKMTLDSALYLQYDKNEKERSYGLRAEWSYLPTTWISLSLNGEWQARGKAHHTKTYHQLVGAKISLSF